MSTVSEEAVHELLLGAGLDRAQIGEGSQSGALTTEQREDAALGNAVALVSKERWKRVIFRLNKKLHPLAEEDIFSDEDTLLLDKVFKSKIKDHLESLQCPSGARERERDRKNGQNFRQGHSQYLPCGSSSQRCRGGGCGGSWNQQQRRYQPYNKGKENF